MAYAYSQDVPINAEVYGRILDGLGPTAAEGLVVHLAIELPEGGLRYIDVWESQEQADRFTEQRLHPVVGRILQGVFGDQVPSEPEKTPLDVIDVWSGPATYRPRLSPAGVGEGG